MEIDELRKNIDETDRQITELLKRRMEFSAQIADYKKQHNLPILNSSREQEVLAGVENAAGGELSQYIVPVYTSLLRESRRYQNDLNKE